MPKRPTCSSGLWSKPSTTFLETHEWTMVPSKMRAKVRKATSSWNLESDITLLPNIPLYYIPSPTRLILKDTNPKRTANAIVDVISKLSCVAEYNESQACALIESTGNVKLLINLYRHEKNQILVELHRVDGDVMEYHSLSRAIFHAARQNQSSQSQTSAIEDDRKRTSVPLTLKHPPRPTVLSNRIKNTLQNEAAVNKTMENIQNLITKDRTDAVRLGMESLSILTGESSSRKQVQLAASKAVLCNDSSWPDIQGMLFGIVMDSSCSEHIRSEEKEDSCSDVDDSEFDTQLRLALTIIGNSANVLCKEMEDNSDSFVDLDKFKELLFILYDYVKEHTSSSSLESLSTSSHTQTVYQALRCMFYLISLSEELKNEAIDAGVQGVAGDCIGGGCTKHKLLSDISQEIVAILGQKS